MTNFWALVERSIIIQGLITLTLLGVIIYLTVSGQEVPETIQGAFLVVLGFYFGSKVEHARASSTIQKLQNGE